MTAAAPRRADAGGALAVLQDTLTALRRHLAGEAVEPISLAHLGDADRACVSQVLGEGEVAAQVSGEHGLQAQESVFTGVWRVWSSGGETPVRDSVEVGAFPRAVAAAAQTDGRLPPPANAQAPCHTMNAPAVLEELREQARTWRRGEPARVIDLSQLPLTPGDNALLDQQLGRGCVQVLSRGYGHCRVLSTLARSVWRVTCSNAQDVTLLDTLHVGDVPDVVCATQQDLEDSAERLAEALQRMQDQDPRAAA
jgi:hydrogenase-1 operon protein HyaF